MNRNQTSFRNYRALGSKRGIGTVEGILLVIGFCFACHYSAAWLANWTGAEWTESRLQALAEKTVFTAKMARQAGVDMVNASDIDGSLRLLGAGETPVGGQFANQTFAVKELADAKAREKLKRFLKIERGYLVLMTEQDRRIRGLD